MIMRRRLFGLRLEQYWFDPEGYRNSRAQLAALRTTEVFPEYALRIPEKTLWVDLRAPREEILAGFHKRTREYIRSGQNRYTVARAESDGERRLFYDHYARFARERRLPLPDPAEEGELQVYLARDGQGELLHGCAFLAFAKPGIFRYRYGVRIKDSHAHPSLFWRAICDSRDMGFRHFDLGGVSGGQSGDPHMAGIDRFKHQFGGKPVEGWLYIRSPLFILNWGLRCLGPLLHEERRLRRALSALAPRVRHGEETGT